MPRDGDVGDGPGVTALGGRAGLHAWDSKTQPTSVHTHAPTVTHCSHHHKAHVFIFRLRCFLSRIFICSYTHTHLTHGHTHTSHTPTYSYKHTHSHSPIHVYMCTLTHGSTPALTHTHIHLLSPPPCTLTPMLTCTSSHHHSCTLTPTLTYTSFSPTLLHTPALLGPAPLPRSPWPLQGCSWGGGEGIALHTAPT